MRTRSEYRLDPLVVGEKVPVESARQPAGSDRGDLARLMLDAYRGSVDDEGETEADALEAVDYYLRTIDRERSLVVELDGRLIAMCFVLDVDGLLYVDPIAVASGHKGTGVGRSLVAMALDSMAETGVEAVGAVITDGNTPSERLFTGLGFTRVGSWPSQAPVD